MIALNQNMSEEKFANMLDTLLMQMNENPDFSYAFSTYRADTPHLYLDIDRIKKLNNIATSGLKPDLTIVLDVDVETSQKRVGAEKDRMESAGIEFFERVRQGYLEIAKQEPERVKVVDSTKTIEEIHQEILELVGR